MYGRRKKRVERAENDDGNEQNYTPAPPLNFARLTFFGVTLLGYTRRELRFISISELLDQYEEYCAFRGIKTSNPEDPDYDDFVLPSEVI